ncbi:cobalamin B12-binding domain-containing protein [Desulfoferula mesophila]|uniref:5-methyltetrahydrofolate--homocysteine methyltransferase n=1 Tax=Desulfoferula mesophila TaxID=3058419 RepID=A0AAU9EBR4_9BACT|nr:5-methyltetrahydrofolate--homocysteine methyltransferase [Desulfoferula mesophilus]
MNDVPERRELEPRLERLVTMVTQLREEDCLAELQKMLDQGVDPKILLECFMEGMRRIGAEFEAGNYFIAALIMAGEIMRSAMELLSPYLASDQTEAQGGTIVLGTIQGDIHDLGKNLFALLLQCHGFKVVDLGVDVPGEEFLRKALETGPEVVGISCVLTTSVENLKEAVALLKRELPQPQPAIVIGGTCLDEQMARYVGSALWASDAAAGLKICQKVLREPAPGGGVIAFQD